MGEGPDWSQIGHELENITPDRTTLEIMIDGKTRRKPDYTGLSNTAKDSQIRISRPPHSTTLAPLRVLKSKDFSVFGGHRFADDHVTSHLTGQLGGFGASF